MKQNKQIQKENKEQSHYKNLEHSYYSWILLTCILVFVTYVRIRLLSTPLERDEGEYAYMGQLLLQGVPPYQEAFNMKLPGTNMIYAFFMLLFGETITAIHLGFLIVNLSSIVLLYLLTQRWFNSRTGLVAAMSFSMITLSPALLGFAAHAAHFVIFFTLGGLYLLDAALEHKKRIEFFITGFLFGCAFLMKQSGLFFLFLGISILLFHKIVGKIHRNELLRFCVLLLAGFSIPVLCLFLIIFFGGTFDRFWFWVVDYALIYGSMVQFDQGLYNLKYIIQLIWSNLPLLCICTGIGLVLLIAGKFQKNSVWKLVLFGLFSMLAIAPGWYFRHHYFILIAPTCSMLIGAGILFFQNTPKHRSIWKYLSYLLLTAVICENILSNKQYYFTDSPVDVIKKAYLGFFPESIVIGDFLASHTLPSDRIAVLGSEPQIYFYAKRRSASGYIYMYSLMEPHRYARKMQEEFIADIERVKPKYLILYNISNSWNTTPQSELLIADWSGTYISKYYRTVGMVDFTCLDDPKYIFGNDIEQYEPLSKLLVLICERTEDNW